MDKETSDYLKNWGHLPFWYDMEGFEKRVKLIEEHGYNKGMKLFLQNGK